ncbi:single-stranded DNA-binding protein [Candidatus Margulisiibacteriota bacterium]
MSNLNKIVLVGRVATEVELRYITDGSPLAKFRIAVDRPKRSDGAQKADFLNIVAWNKLAEICAEYLKKGRLILIEGRIQVRSYDTDEGKRKYVTEIIAQNMRMLEGLSARTAGETAADTAQWPSSPEGSSMVSNNIPAPGMETEAGPVKTPPAQTVSDTADAPAEAAPAASSDSETFYTEDDIPF